MLQIPETSSALKPMPIKRRRKRTPSPFDVIDKNISPVTGEGDLEGELDRLAASNEASAMVGIYWAYVGAAEAILGEDNKPRAETAADFLGGEWCHLINKSYAVADRLKRIPVTRGNAYLVAAALMHAASAMGANLTEIAAVAGALAVREAEAR
ncbi:hypothetical protein Nham_3361 [Nitrobacter hamburgensis X14]|uniref:Uncharacterized protein n=1 Tax=Nitrobacter hamburgensis (strain DSM 10229 / NCIMB 13809 / X14) TaxID=323097 RepID=Q1QI55_NITHX|nr:hypothetical protein [Nitrobacter hamburgensis]ABE64092.1 hypothetical protein Nham_3361 [Nitrobacter hamburgensis X14]